MPAADVTDRPWHPGARLETLRARADLLSRLRGFFAQRGVLEVETPQASLAAGTDPALASAPVELGDGRSRWLATSPEFPMKRLLAAGSGDIYQIARVFRQGEAGRWHNPEFTLLEWYRLGFDHHALMDEIEALLGELPGLPPGPAERRTFASLVPADRPAAQLLEDLRTAGVAAPPRADESDAAWRELLLDLYLGDVVGPTLGHDAPCFVYGYPPNRAALARVVDEGAGPVAARFELYLRGVELANGFFELDDAAEQGARFAAENRARVAADLPTMPIDQALLDALANGLPRCAGVALGVDRLLMVMYGLTHIDEALAFSASRA